MTNSGIPISQLSVVACVLVCAGALASQAATDPDIDPAEPMELSFAVEDDSQLELVDAQLHHQINSDGLPYLRVDYTVVNQGDEAIVAHRLRLKADELDVTAMGSGEIEVGAERSFSHLVFGVEVGDLSISSVGTLEVAGSFDPNCGWLVSEPQCQQQAAMSQAMCWGTCVASGSAGGTVSCMEMILPNNPACVTYTPVCMCQGRSTMTEAAAEGLPEIFVPEVAPWFDQPSTTEVRQMDHPMH